MKTKKKFLIGLMSACLLAGVGTAVALNVDEATGKVNGNVDSAVVFTWGSEAMPTISELKAGTPQYTYFSATVRSTKSVAGTATVSFKIEPYTEKDGKTAVLKGITVGVYNANNEVNSTNMSTYAVGDALFTLDATHLTNSRTITVTAGESANTNTAYYVLKFTYTSTPETTLGANEVLDGRLTLDSSWA